MNIQLIILCVAGFLAMNTYYDNKYILLLKSWKKYYVMGGYLLGAFFIILYINKNPKDGLGLIRYATNTVKYMPIDKHSSDLLSPMLKHADYFTSVQKSSDMYVEPRNYNTNLSEQSKKTGSVATKRNVSEAKKKYVAAQQNWRCGHCQKQLPAWFEVDHIKRLEYGGSNDISNLSALCRECHGKKTTEEHLNIL